MTGTTPLFRRRSYANLCREFIDNASGDLIALHNRGDDIEDKMVGLKNLAYCMKGPVPYYFSDMGLRCAIFIAVFRWPQAILAAAQDNMAIKYADSLALRITLKDAFSADLIKRRLPEALKTPAALDYAEKRKLPGLSRLIQRALP